VYSWIWHRLPGPTGVKVAEALSLLVAVLALLFFVLFPAVSDGGLWNPAFG
jgi:hypothetical protein